MAFNLGGAPPILDATHMGIPDFLSSLQKGFQTYKAYHQAKATPKILAEELLAQQLQNKIKSPYAENANRVFEADIGGREASTQNTMQNTLRQKILNSFLPESERLRIEEHQIQNKYLPQHEEATIQNLKSLLNNRGQSGLGTAAIKDENYFLQSVGADNPELSPEKWREAANAYSRGEYELPDGTKLSQPSEMTQRAMDRVYKNTTTAAMINKGLQAMQADAEIQGSSKTLKKYGNPYGDTVFGVSPELMKDSLKDANGDKSAALRIGQYMGIQALQNELAAIRSRQAGAEAGITQIQQLMQHSGQLIHNHAPYISKEARKEAERVINESLAQMLKDRMSAGNSPSSLFVRQKESKSPGNDVKVDYHYNIETGEIE